jgi:hypothetical protein
MGQPRCLPKVTQIEEIQWPGIFAQLACLLT